MNKITGKLIFFLFLISFFIGFSNKENKEKVNEHVLVEILYMDHGPVQPILRELKIILSNIEKDITVKWYDYEKDIEFKKQKGVTEHVPIMIWINNKNTLTVNDNQIRFFGFPAGTGPDFARGIWTLEDFKQALSNTIKKI